MNSRASLLIVALVCAPVIADPPPAPELKDGDVVALIGGGFIEREAQYGYIETALTARYADRDIKFRNLGWSGDTVWCESRAYFGTPEDGFKHLLEHVDLVKPTVIIVNYGANEAFAGEAGLQKFIDGYNRLLVELEKRTKRIILVPPTFAENVPPLNLNIVLKHNEEIERYAGAVQHLAGARGYDYLDLRLLGEWSQITDDGIRFNESGYRAVGDWISCQFGGGTKRFLGEWIEGNEPVQPDTLEKLRVAVVEKNDLFFHRHRPQNETYLRGFRKHEQGNNAVEIFEFEKLVAEKEAEIARLRGELLKALQAKEGGK
jgi:lysophospholipase L1-like esterase